MGQITDELSFLLGQFTGLLMRAGSSHPSAQAVARELVGTRHGREEWCVFWGADDPNSLEAARVAGYFRRDIAENVRTAYDDARIAYCTVSRTPWQVVDTEGGDQS